MSESTAHPRRLWIVDEDKHAGFAVREVDVEPLHPETPPQHGTRYHVAGKGHDATVMLDRDAYRTKAEALEEAIRDVDDVIYEWEQKRNALEDQLDEALEEGTATADDEGQDDDAPHT